MERIFKTRFEHAPAEYCEHGFLIDPYYRDFLPYTSSDTDAVFRQLLERDGKINDPLILWQEKNTLVDGHRRYRIGVQDLGLEFTTEARSFKDKSDVLLWIRRTQAGRRNLCDHDNTIMVAQLKQTHQEAGLTSIAAAEAVANELGCHSRKVFKAVEYEKAMKKLGEQWRALARTDLRRVGMIHFSRLSRADKQTQDALLERVLADPKALVRWSHQVGAAIRQHDPLPAPEPEVTKTPEPVDVELVVPYMKTRCRSTRTHTISLLDKVAQAGDEYQRAVLDLFISLDKSGSYPHKRISALYRSSRSVLQKIREEHT